MHLEVLYSRSVMEAQCRTILGCSPHSHRPGSPSIQRLGDHYCVPVCWVFSFTQQKTSRVDGLSPRQVILHIVIYKVLSSP